MQTAYLVHEEGSDIVFGVVVRASLFALAVKYTAEAVKEEFCYSKVKVETSEDWRVDYKKIKLVCSCTTEDGEEEIRRIVLTQTPLYHEQ